jgi:hypothetical protein
MEEMASATTKYVVHLVDEKLPNKNKCQRNCFESFRH